MRLRASDLAAAAGGQLLGPDVDGAGEGGDVVVAGAGQDTRTLQPGQLFVPVVAERDGHDFIPAAIDAGAPAYLSARGPVDDRAVCIAVDDTSSALLAIGRLARDRLPERVVAVTGSVGKTTVKDLTAAALRTTFVTASSERSFNNELGVPLTLVNAPDDTAAAVIEMGARGVGHIALLCQVARPVIGVVTVVAAAHTELFGSVDAVAEAKGELVEALPADGTAVLNAADHRVAAMAPRTRASVLTYSADGPADLTADAVVVDDELRARFRMSTPWGSSEVQLGVRGAHNVANALAASAAALAAGAALEAVVEGLAAAQASPWRMEVSRAPSGLLVVNDAYNANPTSMEAALRSLARVPARRRLAVLGVMAELGAGAAEEHLRIGALADELGIEVVAVGTDAYGSGHPVVDDTAGALAWLARSGATGADTAVLVKGSRVAGLEVAAAELAAS